MKYTLFTKNSDGTFTVISGNMSFENAKTMAYANVGYRFTPTSQYEAGFRF